MSQRPSPAHDEREVTAPIICTLALMATAALLMALPILGQLAARVVAGPWGGRWLLCDPSSLERSQQPPGSELLFTVAPADGPTVEAGSEAPDWASATGLYRADGGGDPKLLWALPSGPWRDGLGCGEQLRVRPDERVLIATRRGQPPHGWLTAVHQGGVIADLDLGPAPARGVPAVRVEPCGPHHVAVAFARSLHWIDLRNGQIATLSPSGVRCAALASLLVAGLLAWLRRGRLGILEVLVHLAATVAAGYLVVALRL